MPRISITTDSGTVTEIIEVTEETILRLIGKSGTSMQQHCTAISLADEIKSALRTAAAMQKRGD